MGVSEEVTPTHTGSDNSQKLMTYSLHAATIIKRNVTENMGEYADTLHKTISADIYYHHLSSIEQQE